MMSSFNDFIKSRENTLLYQMEKAKFNFIRNINKIMKEKNITEVDLAKNLGTSKAYITRVRTGERVNYTIELMVKVSMALGGKLKIDICDCDENAKTKNLSQ